MLGFGNRKQMRYGGQDRGAYQNTNANADNAAGQNAARPSGAAGASAGNSAQLDEYIDRRTREIDAQVEEFSRKNPDFDIRRELQDPQFCTYVWGNGLSVEDAYYLVHRNESMNGGERRGSFGGSAQQRERRIPENGTERPGGSGMLKKNPADMSDEEVDDIIKRVRKGEKISF